MHVVTSLLAVSSAVNASAAAFDEAWLIAIKQACGSLLIVPSSRLIPVREPLWDHLSQPQFRGSSLQVRGSYRRLSKHKARPAVP